jgi:hypothetical protein
MTARAERLGCERAAISKGATAFGAANGLDPSWAMKRDTDSYMKARINYVEQSNGAMPAVPARGRRV